MQPFIFAMLRIRWAFYAAIKSLLRTKSLLQAILTVWISPAILKSNQDAGRRKLGPFVTEVEDLFQKPTGQARLIALSDGLMEQFKESLQENTQCMLPSYNHQLPTGDERGTYLGLDVGGSTFRVALIELAGRKTDGNKCKILKKDSFKIDNAVKQLKGVAFFDWMAGKIEDTISGQTEGHEMSDAPLSMGLAWSFPIEQTSLRSGLLQGMGKGFLAAHGLLGQDLGDLIQCACSRKDLNVQLDAIVNDSSATLLSKAYLDPTTRFALILGTGVNAAVHLPVHIFSPPKFGVRPSSWHDSAKHVIVNTELSMFGAGILPFTRWDNLLRGAHRLPDFQPLEHFVSGGYLGEIVRLVLIEGIQTTDLFNGIVPPSLKEPYSLETETLSLLESDPSPNLDLAHRIFVSQHWMPHPPTHADLLALCTISSCVTQRACSILAASIHALWQLRNEGEYTTPSSSPHTLVAYTGSVLEKYPGFSKTCQKQLDILVEASGGEKGTLELIPAEESSLLGAAVAVACLDSGI
jgi:hexokinase